MTHAQESPSHRSAKTVVWHIVAIGISGVAIYVVLPTLTETISAWPRLSTLSPGWLAGAFVAEILSFACTFALQRIVLRTKEWFAVVTAGLAGNAVTNLLPGGDAAGASLQFEMLATAGIDPDAAAGGLTASSLLNIGGLLALPIFTLPVVLGGSAVRPGLVHTALVGLVAFVLYVILGILLLATDKPLAFIGRIIERVWNRIAGRRKKLTGLEARLLDQRNAIRTALGKKWRQAVLLVGGRLGFDYLCLLCVLRAVGSSARPSLVLLAYATANVLALIPITPGGLGIVEASLSGMLVLAGVRPQSAIVATLGYRLANYWLPLPAGAIAFFAFRRRFGAISFAGHKPTSEHP